MRATLEEIIKNDTYKTIAAYFISEDTSLLEKLTDGNTYPDAEGVTICVECPADNISAQAASISVSPYKPSEEGDGVTDYDWTECIVDTAELKELFDMINDQLTDSLCKMVYERFKFEQPDRQLTDAEKESIWYTVSGEIIRRKNLSDVRDWIQKTPLGTC